MSTDRRKDILFGPFEVNDQVFYNSSLCYALVNIKPLLPGHVLVVPYRRVPRLTDLTRDEVTDLFTLVQRVQRMLARRYFSNSSSGSSFSDDVGNGAFNVAIQDGEFSGQSVPHVHVHVIPRTRESAGEGDGIYDRLQGEEGNVGGGLWDRDQLERPRLLVGGFPAVEEGERRTRRREEMSAEAASYRELMELVE